jgi:hypothetical protein
MNHRRQIWAATIVLAGAVLSACDGHAVNAHPANLVPASDMAIQDSRIFFAHQSVGGNIMDGVADLQKDGSLAPITVIDPSAAGTTHGGFLSHALLGKNGDPAGKTDAFVAALESGLGRQLDVAFQKYCFADIGAGTDIDQLFQHYREGMNRIRSEFPGVTLVHVTTPLVRVQSGPRALIKRLAGRTPDHYEDNAARERFNVMMRKEYAGREPVFDLAALESSGANGVREPFEFNGQQLFELNPEYTDDGAHLNAPARRRIASQLLHFLHGVIATRPRVTADR